METIAVVAVEAMTGAGVDEELATRVSRANLVNHGRRNEAVIRAEVILHRDCRLHLTDQPSDATTVIRNRRRDIQPARGHIRNRTAPAVTDHRDLAGAGHGLPGHLDIGQNVLVRD